jgi:adenine-specific DNA methylase
LAARDADDVSSANPSPRLEKKERGAFFTPQAIADYLAHWAVRRRTDRILDPTCGEAVFLASSGARLQHLGAAGDLENQLFGVDIHADTLARADQVLRKQRLHAWITQRNFLHLSHARRDLPAMDAVIGNPPFIRFQDQPRETRKEALAVSLEHGVVLSSLASSWAAVVVHAASFLKPNGRLAMVLPAELLAVDYAAPVREWLRKRFGAVHLFMFDRLQFPGATEKVLLLIAFGSRGCDAFTLHYVTDASDLATYDPRDAYAAPNSSGKWTELLIPGTQRALFHEVRTEHFQSFRDFGRVELGSVTGANAYFVLTESDRRRHKLRTAHVQPIAPRGVRNLQGVAFTKPGWNRLRDAGESVWLLRPGLDASDPDLDAYLEHGERLRIHEGYKCSRRTPWWRVPVVAPPDLFFTYMSHTYPRLITNRARLSCLNSLHCVRLTEHAVHTADALPLIAVNSVTLLGAELFGRSYGGGLLKVEPREALKLPLPDPAAVDRAWKILRPERARLAAYLRAGRWEAVNQRVDAVLLNRVLGIRAAEVRELQAASQALRGWRLGLKAHG